MRVSGTHSHGWRNTRSPPVTWCAGAYLGCRRAAFGSRERVIGRPRSQDGCAADGCNRVPGRQLKKRSSHGTRSTARRGNRWLIVVADCQKTLLLTSQKRGVPQDAVRVLVCAQRSAAIPLATRLANRRTVAAPRLHEIVSSRSPRPFTSLFISSYPRYRSQTVCPG